MTPLWIQCPTTYRWKFASAKPPVMVEPPRIAPGGNIEGWSHNTGWQDNANASSFYRTNRPLDFENATAAGNEAQANQSWLPGAAGTAAAGGVMLGTNALMRNAGKLPGKLKLIGKPIEWASKLRGSNPNFLRNQAANWVEGKPTWMLAPGIAASAATGSASPVLSSLGPVGAGLGAMENAAGSAVSKQVGKLRGAFVDPQQFQNKTVENLRPALGQDTARNFAPIHNPFQQALLSMDRNPNARNAIIGLLLGGLGGGVLGGAAGRPGLGALLGLMAGGALGGSNPQWGQKNWNQFYDGAWNRAGQLNNRAAAPKVPAPVQG